MSRLWAVAALLCCGACDLPPEAEGGGPVVLGSDPSDGDVGVARGRDLRVFFDRPIHPRDVHRGRIAVRSGGLAEFLSAWFEPVDSVLHVENLSRPLDPDTVYRLIVTDVRDLDRVAMEEAYVAVFHTSEEIGAPDPVPLAGWSDVAPIFAARCAGCHGGAEPILGLDLSGPEQIERTAVGVPAEQSRVGVQEEDAWPGASTLVGLDRIDVSGGLGRPGRSYLVYKLLGDPHAAGQPMPPPGEPPLTPAERRTISLWIRAGAPTL